MVTWFSLTAAPFAGPPAACPPRAWQANPKTPSSTSRTMTSMLNHSEVDGGKIPEELFEADGEVAVVGAAVVGPAATVHVGLVRAVRVAQRHLRLLGVDSGRLLHQVRLRHLQVGVLVVLEVQ